MRKVIKSRNIPKSLKGIVAPTCTDDISDSIYKAKDVKDQLKVDQHNKCIYCECLLNGDYGHVEHFRPKKGYTIPPSSKLVIPGYYWLSYEWPNLLLSCSQCNSTYKKNHFALTDETQRDIANRDITREMPLLINPAQEDPRTHLEFHEHILVPKVVNGSVSKKGVHTIELLKLNERKELVYNRRRLWEKYRKCLIQREIANELIRQGENSLGLQLLHVTESMIYEMQDPAAEYSSMFMD